MDQRETTERVLVVDDEENLTRIYAGWLEPRFDVLTATGGEEALEAISDDVDIVLLDRRMPGFSGDEVLDEIRDRGYDPRVVMVTAVDPDFDVVEMGFDDYVVKPVTKDDIVAVVETMLGRSEYDAVSRRFFSLVSKKEALERSKPEGALEESERYAELVEELEAVQERMDAARDGSPEEPSPDAVFREPPEWDIPEIS